MKDEAGFHRALLERPEDDALWSVYTDWLEEQGDPRGELLRLLRALTRAIDVPDRPPQEQRLRELLAAGVRHPGPVFTNSVGMTFVWVWPGTFLMGSPDTEPERSEHETQHPVTLTRGFWMGAHPVTIQQWKEVMGSYSGSESSRPGSKYRNMPTQQVSWEDCQAFMKTLTKREKRKYRLPTEAEWEYACRAGTTTPFYFGDTILPEQANYEARWVYGSGRKGRGKNRTTPVGSYPPNAWGLYDMHGNVREWCADWDGAYPNKPVKDPVGKTPDRWEPARVLRGGWFADAAYDCRSASRHWAGVDWRAVDQGVRVCWS
jgi:uncharacterized protein (TIGR02996 family)